MKYFVLSAAFVLAMIIAQAQMGQPMLYTYKQKQLNDTLQMLFPDLQSKEVPLQNNMPILPLKNDGIKVGSNELGEIYSMQVDNMPCLKPYKTKDEIANAMEVKPVLPVLPKKKE